MTWNPYPRLPRGAVRDLLGITRALYRSASLEDPLDPARLQAIGSIPQQRGSPRPWMPPRLIRNEDVDPGGPSGARHSTQ